jgi:ferredoxin
MMDRPAATTDANCIRCGLCLSVCPTYREHLCETASPREVILAHKGLEGQLRLTPNLTEQMYSCMACMACTEICSVGVRPAELALSMRQIQEQAHPGAWKGPVFAGLIPHPGRMEWATLPIRLYQGLGVRRLPMRWAGASAATQASDLEAMLPSACPVLRQVLHPDLIADPRVIAWASSRLRGACCSPKGCGVRLTRNGCTVIARDIVAAACPPPMQPSGPVRGRNAGTSRLQPDLDAIVTDCAVRLDAPKVRRSALRR